MRIADFGLLSGSGDWLAEGGFEGLAVGFEFGFGEAAGDEDGGIEDHRDGGEGEGEFEAVPGFEFEGAAVVDADGDDGPAGELAEFDDAGLEGEGGAAGAVRGDADFVAFADFASEGDEGAHALLGFGAGAAFGFDAEFGADIGDDLAVATWAGEDGAGDMGEPGVVQPGDEEHFVVPEGPDHALAAGVEDAGVVGDVEAQGRGDAAHEPCEDFASGTDADFGHGRRGRL